MRDAVGGAFMIKVFIVFLLVYIIFIAAALNYARAFRVKNKLIDIIEQNEGINDYTDTSDSSVIGQIETYLNSVSYYVKLTSDQKDKYGKQVTANQKNNGCYERGYCIVESSSVTNGNITSKYYKVTTFVQINFPFFNLTFTIPIKGETRKVERIMS